MGTPHPGLGAANEDGDGFRLRVDAMCRKFSSLPRKVAVRFARRLPSHVDLDDLIGAGGLGLVCAVRQHIDKPEEDMRRLAEQRIRGAILDYLRSVDHLTRRQRAAVSAVTKTQRALEHAGKPHDLASVADQLGMTQDRAEHIVNHLSAVQVTSIDDAETLNGNFLDPSELAANGQMKRKLQKCMSDLPDRLAQLIRLYYGKSMTYKEIGEVMGISRSRICQLHTQALKELRSHMDKPAVRRVG